MLKTPSSSFKLSKSKILRGMQCHKSLWLHVHEPNLKTISESQQRIFDSGTEVGILAQGLFPNGYDAQAFFEWNYFNWAQMTKEAIEKGVTTIYEATFICDEVVVMVDILVKEGDKWNIYEVKSATKVKDVNYLDASVQTYILRESGLDIQNVYITTLNGEYVRHGSVEINELFTHHDVTANVNELLPSVPYRIEEFKTVVDRDKCPTKEIGPHCTKPYDCDFKEHCWKHIGPDSVLNLTNGRGKQWTLYTLCVESLSDIPVTANLTEAQHIQAEAERTGKRRIDSVEIAKFLSNLSYPLYHFDFETISEAIPRFDNTRPYQQIPFQYSLHIEQENGSIEHFEYMDSATGEDPRESLIARMLEYLKEEGSIVVYHAQFEVDRIKELARDFPKYQTALLKLLERIVDLENPFRKKHYYSKEMQGRSSIKKVLPALVPELSYEALAIQNGDMASSTFVQLLSKKIDDIDKTRKELLEYCALDTMAMVKILNQLKQIIK